jgi:hypothetical protein
MGCKVIPFSTLLTYKEIHFVCGHASMDKGCRGGVSPVKLRTALPSDLVSSKALRQRDTLFAAVAFPVSGQLSDGSSNHQTSRRTSQPPPQKLQTTTTQKQHYVQEEVALKAFPFMMQPANFINDFESYCKLLLTFIAG